MSALAAQLRDLDARKEARDREDQDTAAAEGEEEEEGDAVDDEVGAPHGSKPAGQSSGEATATKDMPGKDAGDSGSGSSGGGGGGGGDGAAGSSGGAHGSGRISPSARRVGGQGLAALRDASLLPAGPLGATHTVLRSLGLEVSPEAAAVAGNTEAARLVTRRSPSPAAAGRRGRRGGGAGGGRHCSPPPLRGSSPARAEVALASAIHAAEPDSLTAARAALRAKRSALQLATRRLEKNEETLQVAQEHIRTLRVENDQLRGLLQKAGQRCKVLSGRLHKMKAVEIAARDAALVAEARAREAGGQALVQAAAAAAAAAAGAGGGGAAGGAAGATNPAGR
eukprot:g4251.t1